MNCTEEIEMEQFYNTLTNVLQDVPAHNFLTIVSDFKFNARKGLEVTPFTLYKAIKKNWQQN